MKRLLALICLIATCLPAFSQNPNFPSTMPPSTVYGRSAISAGPGQAIPFSSLIQLLNSTPNTFTTIQTFNAGAQFGPLPWVQASNYAAGSTGAGGLSVRGSTATPNTDGVATWIVQSVTNFAGSAPAFYSSTVKRSTNAAAYGVGAWGEAVDPVGGGSISGGRWTASCTGGTGGNCTGGTNVGICTVSYAFCIGAEDQVWNNTGTDATTTFSSAKFAAAVIATSLGTNKIDAYFLANPNVGAVAINGVYIAAGTVQDSAFRSDATSVYGINLLNCTCIPYRSTSYEVDNSGNVTSNSEAPAAYLNPNLLISKTAPTIGSCGGGSPAISANNGTGSFRVTVGSATSTCVINLPTATTGWNCKADDITQTTTTIFVTKQTASGTTSATLGNFNDVASAANWGTGDVLAVQCGGV